MRILAVLIPLILVPSINWEKRSILIAEDFSVTVVNVPIFPEKDYNELIKISFLTNDFQGDVKLEEISLKMSNESSTNKLEKVTAFVLSDSISGSEFLFGSTTVPKKPVRIKGSSKIRSEKNIFSLSFTAKKGADPSGFILVESITLRFSNGKQSTLIPENNKPLRFGKIVRKGGQDKVDTYRIPGIIKTNTGTLITVYDNRYNNSKDLQENIDIGMSRSTDGGRTWEPMKVIMDMGEYGGKPERMNGTGDPCILYDHNTGTIWVAALWMCGPTPDKMLWWASQPGMKPEETGQLLLVKSKDEGLTWSKPVNITEQIKDPAWQLLLQGPGRGITTNDGTLVFPAQFKAYTGKKAIDGGQYTCHSTIIFSNDGGKTWNIGTGAKSNTTESQVVELSDGSLMLNMRDDRNRKDKSETNGRAVAITHDLGKTWLVHPSSNSALPEPNCMASLISADLIIEGKQRHVLFFSNPDDRFSRSKITIKASLDEGLSWPEKNQIMIFENEGFGYSCLTMVDDRTLGILYEGTKDLYFQKIPVSDIIKKRF